MKLSSSTLFAVFGSIIIVHLFSSILPFPPILIWILRLIPLILSAIGWRYVSVIKKSEAMNSAIRWEEACSEEFLFELLQLVFVALFLASLALLPPFTSHF